jgi:DNA-binding LacI/PurR family transcriptional regulator
VRSRTTIKDVARKAGVSHPTVSRVIHDDPQISEATKLHVRKIMARLGYQPNLIARSLVRNRTQVIALVAPDLNPHVLPVLRGVADSCRRGGYALMLFSTDYWTEENLSYAWVVSNWRVDGVLIYNVVYHAHVTPDVRELRSQEVPFVFINKYLREKQVNTVSVDNFDAVKQVVRQLADSGHRRIGIMNGGRLSVDGVERFQAFQEALRAEKLKFDESLVGNGNFSDAEASEEMNRILRSRRPPTAMFCANDQMAMGVIRAARARKLRVPKDLAVIGFDDLENGRTFTPPLSTVRPPLEDLGGEALRLLVKVIADPARPPEQVALKAKLVLRESS